MLVFRPSGRGSPITALGGLALFLTIPAGVLLSTIGLLRDRHNKAAAFGLAAALLGVLLFLLLTLC